MSTQKLEEALSDLQKVSAGIGNTVEDLVDNQVISMKGLKRVIKAIGSFPVVPKSKLQSDAEGALLMAMIEKMKVTAQQLMVVGQIKQVQQESEQEQGE